tara:strand:- start:2048 stop:2224 length:177 start_codon:yes stop_codon:yes gene_type:complete
MTKKEKEELKRLMKNDPYINEFEEIEEETKLISKIFSITPKKDLKIFLENILKENKQK